MATLASAASLYPESGNGDVSAAKKCNEEK
jgi:hypothetical protein